MFTISPDATIITEECEETEPNGEENPATSTGPDVSGTVIIGKQSVKNSSTKTIYIVKNISRFKVFFAMKKNISNWNSLRHFYRYIFAKRVLSVMCLDDLN